MELREQILSILNSRGANYTPADEIISGLGIDTAEGVKDFYVEINNMADESIIIINKKGKIATPQALGMFLGALRGNQKGFAFLLRSDGEDIFIPKPYIGGAFDGDTVLVKPLKETRGNSIEGEVIKIIKRGRTEIIGTYLSSGKYGFVVPDDKRFNSDVFVSKIGNMNASSGDKVVVKIDTYESKRKCPEGSIIEILGSCTDPWLDIMSTLRMYNIKREFSENVLNIAESLPKTVDKNLFKDRRDFTNDLIITIDGEDAKDLDDAISLRSINADIYELSVHIADVSEYVTHNSPLDKEALERATSVYFPGLVVPMLPPALSNGICSLNENVLRLTLSVVMQIDRNGKILSHEICEGIIKTAHRMTYTSVTKILEGDAEEMQKFSDVVPMLKDMEKLALTLSDMRTKRGSIDFDMPECKIDVDENGKVLSVKPYERKISNRMIEEFMILTNEVVAEFMCRLELPFIYRIHESPSEEKMLNFRQFLAAVGINIKYKGELHPRHLLDLLDSLKDSPLFPVVNRVMLRSMQKAKYSPDNVGHFGLGSDFYCHFTSPIRRYPDLMIHRIIKYMLRGKLSDGLIEKLNSSIYAISNQSSEREVNADMAERDIDDLKKAEYMKDKIGEKFQGVVSGVTNFGVFVELKNTVEGLIKIDKLPKDMYNYIETKYSIVGSKHSYRLGDVVDIIVESVNIDSKRVEFLIDEDNIS